MRYKIRDIPAEGRIVDLTLPRPLLADALGGTEADLDRAQATVHVELSRMGDAVFARGSLNATVMLPCGLCLQPTEVQISAPIKMTFTSEPEEDEDDEEGAAADDPLDDVDFGHHDGSTLDLEPSLREQIILALPMAPRCRPECRGLCATCGQDLNQRDCGHGEAESAQPSALSSQLQKVKDQFPRN